MKSRMRNLLLVASLLCGLGTSAQAQERVGSFVQRIAERAVEQEQRWRPKPRPQARVSTSRYRGTYSRPRVAPRRTYGTRVWVPGHYENVAYKVWIPERIERIWVPPVYETRYRPCGTAYQVLIKAGFWKRICHPGHYETRYKKAWVPGRYERRTDGRIVCR